MTGYVSPVAMFLQNTYIIQNSSYGLVPLWLLHSKNSRILSVTNEHFPSSLPFRCLEVGQQLIIYLDDIVALWDNIHSFLLLPSFDWGKHRIICEAGKTSSKKKASGNGSEIEQKMLRALPTPRFMSTPPIGQLVRRPPAFKDLPTPPCPICFAQNWISAAPSRSVKCRFWDADCQVYVFAVSWQLSLRILLDICNPPRREFSFSDLPSKRRLFCSCGAQRLSWSVHSGYPAVLRLLDPST